MPAELKLADSSAEQLFDFIASKVRDVYELKDLCEEHAPSLAFAFSFALRHVAPERAILLQWAKGWETPGVVGKDVGQLLDDALRRRGVPLRVQAVVNDCVGALLSLPLGEQADIAVIVGTGTNACYFNKDSNYIVSAEWAGMLSGFPTTSADLIASGDQEAANFERMVSGLYVPRLVEALLPFAGQSRPLTMKDLEGVLAERTSGPSSLDIAAAARAVTNRSAAIVAAGLAALSGKVAGDQQRHLRVVLDG